MCILVFSKNFVRNASHSKRKLATHDQNGNWPSSKEPVTLVRF